MRRERVAILVSVAVGLVGSPVLAAVPPKWKNCTVVNKRYPHGVGKVGARDHSTGSSRVTNFKRSNKLYAEAIAANRGLDRDRDGIACESS